VARVDDLEPLPPVATADAALSEVLPLVQRAYRAMSRRSTGKGDAGSVFARRREGCVTVSITTAARPSNAAG
jgi:hypothetical protein